MTNTGVRSIQNMQDNRHLNHTSIPWVMLSTSLLYTHKKLVAEFYLPLRKFFKSEPSCCPWNHHCHGSCQQYLTAASLSSLTSLLSSILFSVLPRSDPPKARIISCQWIPKSCHWPQNRVQTPSKSLWWRGDLSIWVLSLTGVCP